MTDSIIINKNFLQTLTPVICCDEKVISCHIDPFCSSDPEKWPSVQNDKQTQIEHPERNSVPGTSYFCSAYEAWHKTMWFENNPDKPMKPLPERIGKLYPEGARYVYYSKTEDTIKGDGHAKDMQRLAAFCENISDAKEKKEEQAAQGANNVADDDKGFPSLIEKVLISAILIALGALFVMIGIQSFHNRRWLKEQGRHIGFWDAFKISIKTLLRWGSSYSETLLLEKSVPVSPPPPAESAQSSPPADKEISPPDVDQIIAEHLQKQPDPWDQILDARHLSEVLSQPPPVIFELEWLSHDALYELQRQSPELRDQPLFVQLYIEDMAIKEWDDKTTLSYKKGKPDKQFLLEFANRYLRHDLDVYRGSATEWVKEIWHLNGGGIYKEFGMEEWSTEPPSVIMDLLNRVPPHGMVINPLQIIERIKKFDWMIESHKSRESYRGIILERVIRALARIDVQIEHYPFGELEARLIVESWDALSDENKMAIMGEAQERNDLSIYSEGQIIPDFYMTAWHDRFMKLARQRQVKNSGSPPPAGGAVEGMETFGDGQNSSTPKPVARQMYIQTPQTVMGLKYYLNRAGAVFYPTHTPLGLKPVPARP